MVTISLSEIERDLIGYMRRVELGEAFVIVRDGRPVAEIKPVPPMPTVGRPFGLCAGQFQVPDDFDHPLPDDLLGEFEGS